MILVFRVIKLKPFQNDIHIIQLKQKKVNIVFELYLLFRIEG